MLYRKHAVPARMRTSNQTELEYLRRRVSELESQLRDASAGKAGNYQAIFNLAAVAIATASISDGRFVAVNKKMLEITGYSEEELVGRRFLDITHPEDVPTNRNLYAELVAGLIPSYSYEKRYIRKDGSIVWASTTISLVRDEHGVPTHSIGIIDDITDRRRATEALRESEERFRALANSVPTFVWICDRNGKVTFLNEAWSAYTGLLQEESVGHSWFSALHPDDLEISLEIWEDARRQRVPYEVEVRYRNRDGLYRWFISRAVPVEDASNGVVSWFGTSTDIEDYKRAEAALRHSKADLEQFAYAAAHDLQEPLRMVSIYAELLGRRYKHKLAPEADVYIKHATDGAKRMQRLVEDLLAYTRIVHADQEPQLSVNTNSVLEDALANLAPYLDESGAKVTADPLPQVKGIHTRLLQLLQNLIGNAIKYRGEDPPRIHVSAIREARMWRFAVRDNGIGIHSEYHKKIFGVFKRLHGREVAGTGIGLAICKRIVEHAGGEIWVESAGPGAGSTFLFTLPAAPD
jgi:PAS domain S-box-containing protein